MKGLVVSTLISVAALILLANQVEPAKADQISVIPTSDKDAGSPFPFDITMATLNPEEVPFITVGVDHLPPRAEFRSALEFDLSLLPADSVVNSATLTLSIYRNGPFPSAEVHGYVGDGVVELEDMVVSNLLTTFDVPDGSGFIDISMDVSDFVQLLVQGGAEFAGFSIRGTSPAFVIASREFEGDRQPRLDIDFIPPCP
jgi:hypothetical protein